MELRAREPKRTSWDHCSYSQWSSLCPPTEVNGPASPYGASPSVCFIVEVKCFIFPPPRCGGLSALLVSVSAGCLLTWLVMLCGNTISYQPGEQTSLCWGSGFFLQQTRLLFLYFLCDEKNSVLIRLERKGVKALFG